MSITRTSLLALLCALAGAAPAGAVVGGRVTRADAGHPLVCSVTASNDGAIRADRDGEDPAVAKVAGLWAGGGRVLSPDTASDSAGSV
jgi:hypothetical protein